MPEPSKNTECHNACKPMLALGRLTSKKLVKWLNEKFIELEIKNYEVTSILRTHFNQNDYECGACRLLIYFKDKTLPDDHFLNNNNFMCFYKISELEWYLQNGYRLWLKDNSRQGYLKHFELDVQKI
jgi:hypothetical protein